MSDLISRQVAIDAAGKESQVDGAYGYMDTKSIVDLLNGLPSAEPERKKGEWIANGDIPKECPFCGEDWDKYVFGDVCYTGELPKFCPNCGAEMEVERKI